LKKIKGVIRLIELILNFGVEGVVNLCTNDPKTGLFSRRLGEEMIKREIERGERFKRIFSLVFIDINDLKKVNDTLGHLEGDKMIQCVADHLRSLDIVSRWGGDEFVILLPETPMTDAVQVIKRIENLLSNEKISIAWGLSEFKPGNRDTIEILLNKAEGKMYKDKILKKLSN